MTYFPNWSFFLVWIIRYNLYPNLLTLDCLERIKLYCVMKHQYGRFVIFYDSNRLLASRRARAGPGDVRAR
jgi:hypothetical protein